MGGVTLQAQLRVLDWDCQGRRPRASKPSRGIVARFLHAWFAPNVLCVLQQDSGHSEHVFSPVLIIIHPGLIVPLERIPGAESLLLWKFSQEGSWGWQARSQAPCSVGSGVALMSNFEQLLRGVWKPESNEILHMSL